MLNELECNVRLGKIAYAKMVQENIFSIWNVLDFVLQVWFSIQWTRICLDCFYFFNVSLRCVINKNTQQYSENKNMLYLIRLYVKNALKILPKSSVENTLHYYFGVSYFMNKKRKQWDIFDDLALIIWKKNQAFL